MDISALKEWLLGLGEAYGVNPIIFAGIYVGAIPFFTLSVAWLVRNLRARRSPVLPILTAGSCFVSAYVYLLIAGHNIPLWVYGLIAAMVVYGAWSTYQNVRKRTAE